MHTHTHKRKAELRYFSDNSKFNFFLNMQNFIILIPAFQLKLLHIIKQQFLLRDNNEYFKMSKSVIAMSLKP